ncbi:MAG TPA: HAMP domain-containing sensor histidine kinase [Candidatus Saccharimonadales bacterium]|nr:HAMP domain-containing sensor histidine kinase [Candidatus Saccharimonadales bacterium]
MRKLRSNQHSGYLATSIKVCAILGVGAIVAAIAALTANSLYRQLFIDRARTAALAVDPQQISQLTGTDKDLSQPNYTKLKEKLISIHQANRDSRFVYVMGARNGGVYFNADSEPPTSSDYSPPGQTFDEASDAVKAMFTDGQDLIEGPIRDRWGIWLSALSPVFEPSTHKLVAIIGIDIPAKQYLTLTIGAATLPMGIAAVAATIVAAFDAMRRRHREVVELKAELVSIISHELNSPLAGIRWAAETLQLTPQTDPQRSLTDAIKESSQRLQESVDEVLDLTRLGRQGQDLTPTPTDMTKLTREIFAMQALPAKERRIGLRFDAQWPDKLMVTCDAVKIKRVMNNLISNAIKYSEDGGTVVVGYHLVNGKHRFSITDAGIGIPKSEQAKVFAGFYRASNAVDSGRHGTGLGLYLARKTIQQHGGTLWLESAVGKGTTVIFELPDRTSK